MTRLRYLREATIELFFKKNEGTNKKAPSFFPVYKLKMLEADCLLF